jgi:hypothetical protein
MIEIPPGRSAEQIFVLGDLFDISKPRRYLAKVALLDPQTNRRLESNPVSFDIEDASSLHPLCKATSVCRNPAARAFHPARPRERPDLHE